MHSRTEKLAAEFLGSAFLLMIVVGSGIMGQRLSGGNAAIALLANSIATGCGLFALITALLPVSAHFNPVVTTLAVWRRDLEPRLAAAYVVAQVAGASVGVLATHAMFGEALFQASAADRHGAPLVFAEFIATLGLLGVIVLVRRPRMAAAVGAYITAAYWFTASTSFANPAVALARALTGTFTGIAWVDVPGFLVGEAMALVLLLVGLRGLRRA